jgi:predicted N-acetyltransferase YhbS
VLGLRIALCGPQAAAEVHRLTQLAFGGYDRLDPPSGALRETVDNVRDDLERAGGALADIDGKAVGCLRFEREPGLLRVRRLAIDPAWQRKGLGTALMNWTHDYAREVGVTEVRVGVRRGLPGNVAFYERLGYTLLAEHRHPGYAEVTWLEMSRRL